MPSAVGPLSLEPAHSLDSGERFFLRLGLKFSLLIKFMVRDD